MHWSILIFPAIIALLLCIIGLIGLLLGTQNKGFALILLILGIIIFFIPFLEFKTSKLVLTDKRLYGKTGIIRVQTLTSPIQKIQTVNVEKSIMGKIFGYSDITINCITGIYVFKRQIDAEKMQNAILNLTN